MSSLPLLTHCLWLSMVLDLSVDLSPPWCPPGAARPALEDLLVQALCSPELLCSTFGEPLQCSDIQKALGRIFLAGYFSVWLKDLMSLRLSSR